MLFNRKYNDIHIRISENYFKTIPSFLCSDLLLYADAADS